MKPLARPSATQFFAHTASTNGDDARLAALRLIAVKGEKLFDGFLVGDEAAGEDVARADTRRQRDVEIPTGRKACRPRCRREDARILVWNLHDRGAVVQQIVAIGLEGLTESLLKNRATKAGAVDDEVDGVLALAAQG